MSNHPLDMPIPLRPDWTARVIVPRNVTTEEVERICRVLRTLPQPRECATCGGSPCDCHYDR